MKSILSVPAIVVLGAAGAAYGQSVAFELIPGTWSANDLTPDGRYVVGEAPSGPYRYDRMTKQMMTLPGPGYSAVAVSDDGSVVLGNMPDPTTDDEVAAIWTEQAGWQSLGFLPDALACPSRSSAYELSADGTAAVGLSWDGCNGRGFYWSVETGMIELEGLANGSNRASAMSADGSVIGGFAQGSFSRTPAFWSNDGSGQLIDPPNGDMLGEIYGVDDAGTMLLGNDDGRATIWDATTLEWTQVGQGSLLPAWEGIPMDIADNGTVVGFDILFTTRRAWLWPEGEGVLVELEQYITDNGGDTLGESLEVCQAISADGGVIIGHGFFSGGWIVTIESACDGDLDDDGMVGAADLAALLSAWGPNEGSPADLDGDGMVGASDLAVLLSAWGSC